MPNTKSAKKELRKSAKRVVYNKRIKDNVKNLVKKTRKAIYAKNKNAESLIQDTFKTIDRAAQKGIIKPNTRDRKKARLQALYNKTIKA